MTDFVLIHETAHGAWCWREVTAALAQYGDRAYVFDLPGHGADLHPRQQLDRHSYRVTIEAQILQLRLRNAVLVGHGLAGSVLPEVIARYPECFRQVIFFAAVALEAGECALAYLSPDYRRCVMSAAATTADCTLAINFATAQAQFFNDLSAAAARRWFRKLTPAPTAPYLVPTEFAASRLQLPRDYLLATADRHLLPAQAQRCAAQLGCQPRLLTGAGHDAMLSQPRQLAAALHEIALTRHLRRS
ncbi:alpha/beta fold hydrolase [Thiospirillum jenense]|uniref:Alpha/beta fold hydrolase n=1 Tax=Thiospirillum jenense TaxID=1653858 RepID=A0A839HGF4_9GAMM|nr:alpha/beta fold hydrolase [Thiospirillum jenense]MBB1125392.1 alpha/beta fold hydrolase [Thiospirillum jenense]